MSPPSSGSKNKPRNKPNEVSNNAGFLLGSFFDPEDGGDMFFRNFSRLSTDYRALYPRRENSS
jgi:hypothetical protein